MSAIQNTAVKAIQTYVSATENFLRKTKAYPLTTASGPVGTRKKSEIDILSEDNKSANETNTVSEPTIRQDHP